MSDLDCQFGDLPVGLRKILLSMIHGLAPSPAVLLTIPNGQPVFLLSGVTLLSLQRPKRSSLRAGPAQWEQEARMEASEETPSTCSWKLSFHFLLTVGVDI